MGAAAAKVGGKTGTAQRVGSFETAWFAGVAPIQTPRWAVVVVIEEGGSGGKVAAPIARRVFQYLLDEEPTELTAGDEAD